MPAIAGAGKTWSAQEQRARLAAMGMMVPIGFKPDKYHRAPTWDSAPGAGGPGASVDSCEEYVYESFYDMERWIDATNACRSDARCAMTMTFWGYDGTKSTLSPGVANRDLRNKAGVPIKSYYGTDFQMSLFGGTAMSMAKNEYFAGSAAYVPDSMVAALTAMNPTWGAFAKDLQALRQGGFRPRSRA